MNAATNPANYRTVTRNHKPCLVCVDCGRESLPGSRSLTHARNCDLAGARGKTVIVASDDQPLASAAAERRVIVEQATPVSDDRIFAAYERGYISMSEAMNRDF